MPYIQSVVLVLYSESKSVCFVPTPCILSHSFIVLIHGVGNSVTIFIFFQLGVAIPMDTGHSPHEAPRQEPNGPRIRHFMLKHFRATIGAISNQCGAAGTCRQKSRHRGDKPEKIVVPAIFQ